MKKCWKKLLSRVLCLSAFGGITMLGGMVETLSEVPGHPTSGYVMVFDNETHNSQNKNYVDIGVNLHDMGLERVATFEAWVKSYDTSRSQDLISDWASEQGLTVRVTTTVEGYVYPGDYRISKTQPQTIFENRWHHVAMVLDEDVMYGYVDGVLITKVALGGPIGDSPATLKIGMRGDDGNRFYGAISDVRIWNIARSGDEIAANKDKRLTGTEEGLIGYWKLDEGSGDTAKDSTGKHDGKIYGATYIKEEGVTGMEIEQGDNLILSKGVFGDKLTVKFLPEGVSSLKVNWSSSNEEIVKVDKDGSLTAVELGNAVITAETGDGKFKDSILITVEEHKTPKNDYTFVVMPDTQYYASAHPNIYTSISQWINDNAEKEKIKFVMHVGDVTDDNSSTTQWERAKEAMSIFENKVPYAITIGNHDYQGVSSTRSTKINEYFPVSDFEKSPTYGGVFEEGKINNVYHLLTVGEVKYLVIVLEFGPRDEVLDWANEIAGRYPDHRAIVITHCYMNYDGKRVGRTTDYTPYVYPIANDRKDSVNDGDDIWEKLVKKHKNMFMVFSGHIPCEDVVYRVDEGENGNKVMQVLADPQWYGNGGEGLLLLMRFDESGQQVSFEWYSPYLGKYFKTSNQFTVNTETKEEEETKAFEQDNSSQISEQTERPDDSEENKKTSFTVYIAIAVVVLLCIAVGIGIWLIKKRA